jgi:phospholipase C
MKNQSCGILFLINACLAPFAAAQEPAGTIKDVQHVVIFMQENRSFDHYFGTLKGVRGFGDPNAILLRSGKSVFHQTNNVGEVPPLRMTSQCVPGTDHGWISGHTAWNFGYWDQWISAKGNATMTYYTRAEMPFHYALADAYTICDAYHCSVFGPTNPNRLYLWTGMIDPNGTGGGPITDNGEPGFTWTTYPERLQSAGISWKVYQEFDNYDDNALAWFEQYRNASPGEPLYDRGMSYVDNAIDAFRSDVINDKLPQVSWLIAPTGDSEHPSFSPATGAAYTKQLLDALFANPKIYNSTVFIFTYDENDGLFDHVPPPTPFPRTPDEFLDSEPIGLGVRVPTIIVSPWSRGGYVCSQVFDHTSILRFLEKWTGVQEPNISQWRRALCGDLSTAFDFGHPDYSVPNLPAVAPVDCFGGTTPPVSANQNLPVQEQGTRPARALPYQPNAVSSNDCAHGKLTITMTNSGTASVHFMIYGSNFRVNRPLHFDVAPNAFTSASYDVTTADQGKYDYTCYGPNGFQRRFVGNISNACGLVDVTSGYDLDNGALLLSLRNESSSSVTFTIAANAYQTDGPWSFEVPTGQTSTASFPIVAKNNGYYDFTATLSNDPLFLRRFSGHLEAGAAKPKIAFAVSGRQLLLTWPGSVGLKLQTTPTLSPPSWTDLPNTIGTSSITVPFSANAAYYRVAQ